PNFHSFPTRRSSDLGIPKQSMVDSQSFIVCCFLCDRWRCYRMQNKHKRADLDKRDDDNQRKHLLRQCDRLLVQRFYNLLCASNRKHLSLAIRYFLIRLLSDMDNIRDVGKYDWNDFFTIIDNHRPIQQSMGGLANHASRQYAYRDMGMCRCD